MFINLWCDSCRTIVPAAAAYTVRRMTAFRGWPTCQPPTPSGSVPGASVGTSTWRRTPSQRPNRTRRCVARWYNRIGLDCTNGIVCTTPRPARGFFASAR